MTYLFLFYPQCSTCMRAKSWLDDHKIQYTARNIKENPPTASELSIWYKTSKIPLKKFFNSNGLEYKSLGLKNKIPQMTEKEQLHLLATSGMLVRRPLLISAPLVLVGFKESDWERQI